MSAEQMGQFPPRQEKIKEGKGLKLINEQLAKAVSQEDYEQASFLRDTVKRISEHHREIDQLTREDIMGEASLETIGNPVITANNPGLRAWNDIRKRQEADMLDGKNIVGAATLSNYFEADMSRVFEFIGELQENMETYKFNKGVEKADFIASLYTQLKEASDIAKIAEKKLNNIWSAYSQHEKLNDPEDAEYRTYLQKYANSDESKKISERIPYYINRPLSYWQGVYDNATRMVNEIEFTIEELKE